ncbi:zinc ribbon domain-containing protein [Dictyobacter formicarum]|uniref:Zinc-ribbon domain-containing protein n=1 Tax=Dictyobacter formicarum TaxID=2778368 RepID=A0ABQ3VAA9_9CHLR|nr:zinc ribbon domain-containing protein [Dictyobacter formicarum]GHO83082.1 hypothetical protein KSZ_10880 [Dictyobacter formicarum]
MNLWDSVHRSLEKASNSAGRIAKIQRTRLQIEKLGRQITAQEQDILKKVMELYTAGLLTQPELLTPCQDLFNSHQQLSQAQHELQALQSQGPPVAPTGTPGTTHTSQPGEGDAARYTPPPPYSPAIGETTPPVIPPPPPGMGPLTIHSQETMIVEGEAAQVVPNTDKIDPAAAQIRPEMAPAQAQQLQCPGCGTAIQADDLYCPTCGRALHPHVAEQLPTARVTSSSPAYPGLHPDQIEDKATVRSEDPPPATDTGFSEKDRG